MSINQKHFGLSDSLVNAVNEALKGKQHAIDVAEPKGKITGADFKKLRGEGSKPDFLDIDKDGDKTEPMKKASKEIKEDDAHFAQQSKKMQDAINMHLRKGKSYADAAKAAKVHVKEEVEIEEGFVVRYNNPKSEKHGSEKHFDDQVAAKKHATRGNLIDKVGGKYTVHKTNEKGHDVKEEALDEKAVSQAQQKAAGAALATQRGEYAGGKKGGAVNRMALMKRAELKKIASTKRKGLPMRKEEVGVIEADDAVSKQIAAKKDAMKKQIQQKIAQKQMSTMQAKANKRLSSINASNDMDKEDEKEMKKGGKEKIEINPAMRD